MSKSLALILASAVGVIASADITSAAILSDTFDGAADSAPDAALWSNYQYAGTSTHKLDGAGNLVINIGTTSYGNYAQTVSNADNLDAFSQPLSITLSDLNVGGIGGITTTGNNYGWLLYGRSNNNAVSEYQISANTMAYGVALIVSASKDATTGTETFRMIVREFSDTASGGRTDTTHVLSQVPTGLQMVIDGADQSVDLVLTGSTFASSGLNTLTHALTGDFTLANHSDGGTLTSRISVGAINSNATTTSTFLSIGGINVDVVPEPAGLGVAAAAGMLLMRRRRS